jgi:8-oxo-dGTP pyrophosphatase MutT (NUDIX family)
MEKITKLKAWWIIVNDEGQFLAISRKAMGDLSLPKWHCEESEVIEECALREVYEETGRICDIASFVWIMEYTFVSWDCEILSQVHFYRMKPIAFESEGIIEEEISRSTWLSFKPEDIAKLTNQSDRDFLSKHFL